MASNEVDDGSGEDEDMIDLGAPFTVAKVEIGLASSIHNPASNEGPGPISLYNSPRPIEYNPLSREDRRTVYRLTQSITAAWGIMSAATPFPGHLLPDPDPYNWGIPLLRAILDLAQMTGRQYPLESTREEAVHWICQSIEDANRGLSTMEGDWVIRCEDVEYAIEKMRFRGDAYRPEHHGGYQRGGHRRHVPPSTRRGKGRHGRRDH